MALYARFVFLSMLVAVSMTLSMDHPSTFDGMIPKILHPKKGSI